MSGGTAQEIDPLSGITARIFVVAVGCVAVLSAGVLTALNADEIVSPALILLAFAALVAGFAYLVWSADPYRRTVTRARYGVTYSLVLVAAILESSGQLGRDTNLRNDWGPIVVALALMVSGSYRRPAEIVLRTAIAAVVVAATTALHTGTTDLGELIGSVTMSGTLVVALGGGAAIFASSLTAALRVDRRRADEARRNRDVRDRRRAIEDFLGTDIESLRRDVLPFLREVKARDVLTDDDRRRAAALAKSLRSSLAVSLAEEPLERLVDVFVDPLAAAAGLGAEQRTALRTVLVHFAAQPGLEAGGLSLEFVRESGRGSGQAGVRMTGELTAVFGPEASPATGIAPFVGLMQLSFPHVDADTARNTIVLRFVF
ncbi:hypothetical protein B7R54_03110 [Subtercola boreus]|uniref:Uncharacterized protein n=1 Tax=Subtercola boreus TaxID=120213 RepID=A0A3E0VEG9_9MICO|nr:hypothetical protein [Subtercola boreus]RFA08324.1 hypothetical protein B7R54_03110 [Subtercola boreus]